MDPRTNPYAPGAGIKPPAFAGREDLLEQIDIIYDRKLNALHASDVILLGLRGVGKTVLLNALHATAKSKGIETIKFEVPDGTGGHLNRALIPALNVVLQKLGRRQAVEEKLKRAAGALRGFASVFQISFEGFSFGATPPPPIANSGNLEFDLPELLCAVADAAMARDTCLAVFIDEVQYLEKKELSALARACHEAAQTGVPLIFIGAGLPQIAALAGEAKSYAERLFLYPEIGALSAAAAREVMVLPAQREGVSYTDAALDLILQQTQRYPYFLQSWGKFAWDQANGTTIEVHDVKLALPDITAHLDQSFFRVRFDRCSALEQKYLRAMAELGEGPFQTGDIAGILGTESAQVAPVRQKLIRAGMIFSQRHGETDFTVPLFGAFMKRMLPRFEIYSPGKRAT